MRWLDRFRQWVGARADERQPAECPHDTIDELVPTIAYECRDCGEIFA